ncbi:hypothetical protein CVG87_13560 [Pseudomonas sp. WCS365]|nr:hypothetical protein CVG87_13560 [Pseudomonas sp. WCS365]
MPAILSATQPPVGASLLAIAVCQLASTLTVLPPSRASSLPQGRGLVFFAENWQSRHVVLILRSSGTWP